jgi:hypothetical protein
MFNAQAGAGTTGENTMARRMTVTAVVAGTLACTAMAAERQAASGRVYYEWNQNVAEDDEGNVAELGSAPIFTLRYDHRGSGRWGWFAEAGWGGRWAYGTDYDKETYGATAAGLWRLGRVFGLGLGVEGLYTRLLMSTKDDLSYLLVGPQAVGTAEIPLLWKGFSIGAGVSGYPALYYQQIGYDDKAGLTYGFKAEGGVRQVLWNHLCLAAGGRIRLFAPGTADDVNFGDLYYGGYGEIGWQF